MKGTGIWTWTYEVMGNWRERLSRRALDGAAVDGRFDTVPEASVSGDKSALETMDLS